MVLIDTHKHKSELIRGLNEAVIIAESVNMARDLVDAPAAELTPKALGQEAKRICKQAGCSVDIWDRRDMEKRGMNAILGVSKGSDLETQLS